MKVLFSDEALCAVRLAKQLAEQTLPDIVTRELAVNAAEAGATEARFGAHSRFPNKLAMLDDGTGMSEEVLIARVPLPGREAASPENKQVGLRALAMAIADKGQSEHPYLTIVTQTKGTGDAHQLDVYFDGYECIPVARIKELGKRSGTLTIIQGNSPSQNTVAHRPLGAGKGNNQFFWIARSLTSRFFDFPKGLTVSAPDYDNAIRRVRSFRDVLMLDGCQILPAVQCEDVEVITVLMPTHRNKPMKALADKTYFKVSEPGPGTWRFGAQVLHVFGSEILGLETGSSTPVDEFGVTNGRNTVAFLVRPTSAAYTVDVTREHIIPASRGRFDLMPVAAQFQKNMPKALKERIAERAAATTNSTQYRQSVRLTDKLVATFGGMFQKDVKGKRRRVKDDGVVPDRRKGFDPEQHPLNNEHPELANLQPDNGNPFPDLRPVGTIKKKRIVVTRGGRNEIVRKVAGVPDVIVTHSEEGEPLELARLVKRDLVTNTLYVEINTKSVPFDLLWNIPGIQSKKVGKAVFIERLEAAVPFKVLTLLGLALETKAAPETYLTPRDLTSALLDPTIFDRVRTAKEEEQAMAATA